MSKSTIRFSTFPRTEAPPIFIPSIVEVFRAHETEIATADSTPADTKPAS
jgi:hypothetical protein